MRSARVEMLKANAFIRKRYSNKGGFRCFSFLLCFAFLSVCAAAKTTTWTGSSGDGKWGTAGNWNGGVPTSGDTVILTGPTANATLQNDILNLQLAKIQIQGSYAFSVKGNPITLSSTAGISNIIQNASVTVTIWNDLVVNNAKTVIACVGGGAGKAAATLALRGNVSGTTGGIWKVGAGTIEIYGNNSFTGDFYAWGNRYRNTGAALSKNGGGGTGVFSGRVSVFSDWALGHGSAYIDTDGTYNRADEGQGCSICIGSNCVVRTENVYTTFDRCNTGGTANIFFNGSSTVTNIGIASNIHSKNRNRYYGNGGSSTKWTDYHFYGTVDLWNESSMHCVQNPANSYTRFHYHKPLNWRNVYLYKESVGEIWLHAQHNVVDYYYFVAAGPIVCGTNDALFAENSSSYLNFYADKGELSLGGFDQSCYTPIKYHSRLANGRQFGISSPKPALLKMNAVGDTFYHGRFMGAAGLCWNPNSTNAPTFIYSNQVSDTTGELVVTNGYFSKISKDYAQYAAIRLAAGASFTSLSRIRLYNDRILEVADDGSGAGLYADEFVSDYGLLRMPPGTRLTCRRAIITDRDHEAQELPPGTYTRSNLSDTILGWERDGEGGTLRVLGDQSDVRDFHWTGAGADDLMSTPENWRGGVAPDFTNGNARIWFDGGKGKATVVGRMEVESICFVTNASFTIAGKQDMVNGDMPCLCLGAGGISNVNTKTSATITNTILCDLEVMVPQLYNWSAGVKTVLRLEGDVSAPFMKRGITIFGLGETELRGNNSGLKAPLLFTNTIVRVYSRHGLGPKMTGREVLVFKCGTAGDLKFIGDGLENDVDLKLCGTDTWTEGYTLTQKLTDKFVHNGVYCNWHGANARTLGDWTFRGGFDSYGGSLQFEIPKGYTTRFEKLPYSGSPNGGTIFWFNGGGTLHFGLDEGYSNVWNRALFNFDGIRWVCESKNVLYTDGICTIGRADKTKSGILDMNGYDQTVQHIQHFFHGTYSSDIWVPASGDTTYAEVTSAEKALLTMTSSSNVAANVKFTGKTSFTYAGQGQYTLCNQMSDTEGTLTVKTGGTVGFKWGAGWGNGKVVLEGTAHLAVDSTSSANAFGGGETDLEIEDEGVLEMAGNVTVNTLKIKGTNYGPGSFSATGFGNRVTGSGTLTILKSGAPGFVIYIR